MKVVANALLYAWAEKVIKVSQEEEKENGIIAVSALAATNLALDESAPLLVSLIVLSILGTPITSIIASITITATNSINVAIFLKHP